MHFHHMFFQSGSFLSRCIYSKTLPLLYFLVCSRRITDYNKYIYFTYKWLIIKFSILSSDRRIYSTHFFNHTEFHFRHSLCLQASAVQSLWKVTLAINSPLHVKHMSCLHMWYTYLAVFRHELSQIRIAPWNHKIQRLFDKLDLVSGTEQKVEFVRPRWLLCRNKTIR